MLQRMKPTVIKKVRSRKQYAARDREAAIAAGREIGIDTSEPGKTN